MRSSSIPQIPGPLASFLCIFASVTGLAAQEVLFDPIRVPVLTNRATTVIGRLTLPSPGLPTRLVLLTGGFVRALTLQAEGGEGRSVVLEEQARRGQTTLLGAKNLGASAPLIPRSFLCRWPTDAKPAQRFRLAIGISPKTPLATAMQLGVLGVFVAGEQGREKGVAVKASRSFSWRPGIRVRHRGDDGSLGYRIPGLARTNQGSLLAIYDVRFAGNRDLQGDLVIGLSRSIDGGQTFEPMRRVLDMGTHGGLPRKFNGVSDASILVDQKTGRVFVFGCWMHGLRTKTGQFREDLGDDSKDWYHQWRAGPAGSGPGLTPRETCQFLMAVSEDDGRTFGAPVNLTAQVKKKEWYLLAPAPGNGITTRDGLLVVPVAGRDAEERTFSTVMWSADRGKTWKLGAPARTNTTECAVVELPDGSWMLNMRDNRNRRDRSKTNGRAVAVTRDRGAHWTVHSSDHRADLLPEPVCMASLLRFDRPGASPSLLLFSNPSDRRRRRHLTLKASFDAGVSWPVTHQLELDELGGSYSCLAPVDAQRVGCLYESSQGFLVFQVVGLRALGLAEANSRK